MQINTNNYHNGNSKFSFKTVYIQKGLTYRLASVCGGLHTLQTVGKVSPAIALFERLPSCQPVGGVRHPASAQNII